MPTDSDRSKVLHALRNERFTWRTINGISAETDLAPGVVAELIKQNAEDIVQSSITNERAEALFTTRERLRKDRSPLARLSSALRNRGG